MYRIRVLLNIICIGNNTIRLVFALNVLYIFWVEI